MTLKVVFVIDSLALGGTEQSVAELIPRLGARGVTTTTVTLYRREPGYEEHLRRAGEDVRVLRARHPVGRVRELRRIIRQVRPDVVHTNLFLSDVTGRLATVGSRVPVLTSLVNMSYEPVRRRDPGVKAYRLEAARHVEGWTARRFTDHFHAVSRAVKESAVRCLGIAPDQITVVERGRDPDRLGKPTPARRRRARAALGLSADAPLILNVGRQEFQKGQRHLLDAFEAIADTHPDAVLVLAGRPGHASVELEQCRRRSPVRERIHFLGAREDIPELLAAADVAALPSLYEGFSGVVVEALALGVPVVASDIPGIRAVVENDLTAVLVPPENPAQLAGAMTKVLRDRDFAHALAQRGRALFEERLTLDVSVQRMNSIYERLVRSPV